MSQQLTLPDELYLKLAQGATERGLTIESLLMFVSELVAMPKQPTRHDRKRSAHIERLLRKFRVGPLTDRDRAELDRLIDADYEAASARADRIIAAKESRQQTSSPRAGNAKPGSSTKRIRK